MHPNEEVLQRLYVCLNEHDPSGMAKCYHECASFRDIAFDLAGRNQIHAMWDVFCTPDANGEGTNIKAVIKEVQVDEKSGHSHIIFTYLFRKTGNEVANDTRSSFEFRDGLIFRQHDKGDEVEWARQAFGGFQGLLLGRLGFLRRKGAMNSLRKSRPKEFPS